MLNAIKIVLLSWLLMGCNMPPIDLFKGGSDTLSLLTLPAMDSGYANLQTRVIVSKDEYKAFLDAVDAQGHWEHKVAFGMKIAKESISFRTHNLLLYKYQDPKGITVQANILHSDENNATVKISKTEKSLPAHAPQMFFLKVSKKIAKVTFVSPLNRITIENSQNKSIIPKECIAWFDGCNHCIRSNTGKALCTKRYCKKKGSFRCMKWQ